MWSLPLVSAVMFLFGTWFSFDVKEIWFIMYAAIYLVLGWIAMFIGKYMGKHEYGKNNKRMPAIKRKKHIKLLFIRLTVD